MANLSLNLIEMQNEKKDLPFATNERLRILLQFYYSSNKESSLLSSKF